MQEDWKKFMIKKPSKEVEIIGFDPDKGAEQQYYSQQVEPKKELVIKDQKKNPPKSSKQVDPLEFEEC